MTNKTVVNCKAFTFSRTSGIEKRVHDISIGIKLLENEEKIFIVRYIDFKTEFNLIIVKNSDYKKGGEYEEGYTHCFQTSKNVYYLNLSL